MRGFVLSMMIGGLAAIVPRTAAAVPCDDPSLGLTNPVYLQVGDTQTALMKRLARAMRDNTPNPVTMLFLTSGSCANITKIYKGEALEPTQVVQYAPTKALNPAWDPAKSPTLTCTAPAGTKLDIANSALFNSACTTTPPAPPTVAHAQGPVQAYVLAVPKASSQTAITFEEAYFVFGFGAAGMVTPWSDQKQLFIRTTGKSTLLAWAANIGVPGGNWKGEQFDGSPDVISHLQNSPVPEKAIGILGAEVYDGQRGTLKSLAFQAKGQRGAYWPDSTPTSFDKKNVRDGHYTVWSPTIWMDNTAPGGAPLDTNARYLVDLIAGKSVTPAPNFDMAGVIAAVGLVPECAMGVTRSFEGGPLSLYQPPESCVCKYESLVEQSNCMICSATTPCATGVCRNGFCEVR